MILIKTSTTKNYDYDINPVGDAMAHPANPRAHAYDDDDFGGREKVLTSKVYHCCTAEFCLVFLGVNDKS